jgi:iron-sulfur cluster repair protein YtfE (RIC family)
MPRNPPQHDQEPLSTLLDDHPLFDEAFRRHQEALLMRNPRGAARHLERFAGLLLPHLAMEEELLLPIFAERGRAIVGAAPVVFAAEHRKIQQDVAELIRRTDELVSCGTTRSGACRASLTAILALIDREYLFKDYLKHHDLRERNALYPELDRVVAVDERPALWKRISERARRAG